MCGIAGIVHLDGHPVNRAELDRMTDALAHRGPDARGIFIDGNVGIGHRRLKIIDLSEAAAQPMVSEDRSLVLTFNGEIYNFAEKRALLESKGHRFRSRSDTEVLLKLYEEFGPACLTHLRGQFAFAVYDKKNRKIFLARDRVGKKPLKYFLKNGVFAFASELKALRTHPDCPRDIDVTALHDFLTLMYLPSPRTGFADLEKLPAGHSLTLDLADGSLKVQRYWQLTYETEEGTSTEEWERRIKRVLEESVQLRMVADVPVGAFLSGGIDSGAVVALMSGQGAKPVKTFTVGGDDPAMDERPQAQLVADRFRTDHHPISVAADVAEMLPTLVRTYEEPYADASAIPTYLIGRETRKFVTVALNGDGGDENFAGYVRYPILLFSEKWSRLPHPFHALVRGATGLFHALRRDTFSYRVDRFARSIELPWEQRYLQYLSFFTEEEKRALERPDLARNFMRTDLWYAGWTAGARGHAHNLLHQAMSMDIETYLADDLLPKVDLGTMAHGLEARSPFLDHELLELTARMPADLKLRGRTGKWILKKMLRDVLPAEILSKRKRGFRVPLDRWFRGERKEWLRDRLLDGHPLFWRMFDRARIEEFLKEYHGSRVNRSDHLWSLLWLQEWLQQNA